MEGATDFLTSHNIGDWASIVSLIIGVFGFAITIWNVVKSKKAAESATEAARDVKRSIVRANTVSDFASAVAVMEEIKRLHRQEAWEVLLDRYGSLRKTLISVKGSGLKMTVAQKSTIQNTIQHFAGIESLVERRLSQRETPEDVASLNNIVSRQIDDVQEVLTEIKSQIGAN